MKVYLDQSIIDEWLKFKSSGVSLMDYGKDPDIIRDLEAFGKILEIRCNFLYSTLNELECSGHRKHLFDDMVSQFNFKKVPAVHLRRCMIKDKKMPEDAIPQMGECESYFASHIRKFGLKKINDKTHLMKYMRKKFFDPMHIDSALQAKADIFLTIDYRLLESIKNHPKMSSVLATKIRIITPYKIMQEVQNMQHRVKG